MDEAQGSAVQPRLEQSRQFSLPSQSPVVALQLKKAIELQAAVVINKCGARVCEIPTLRLDERKRENKREKGKGKEETR